MNWLALRAMASAPLLTGFFLDELLLPWSTLLVEADAHLANWPRWLPYGGEPNLRLACTRWAWPRRSAPCGPLRRPPSSY
jgi:hypothetical protein